MIAISFPINAGQPISFSHDGKSYSGTVETTGMVTGYDQHADKLYLHGPTVMTVLTHSDETAFEIAKRYTPVRDGGVA